MRSNENDDSKLEKPDRTAVFERALGAYLGFAIGDALGATVEFLTPNEISRQFGVHRDIVGGGWLRLAPGQVTDDTTLSLALGDAIIESGGWDLATVGRHFVGWLRAKPVDVGNACRRGIQRVMTQGTLAGQFNEGDAGNGACMRNLPVAISTLYDNNAFERRTIEQCHMTHHHTLSDAATLMLGRMVQRLILGATTLECGNLADKLIREQRVFRFSPYPGRASGYIVDTVQTVLHFFFAHENFETCIIGVVNCGEDADTTGALAGMLAGARCGASQLPQRWLQSVDAPIRARIEKQVGELLMLTAADCK
jgi:ADP-ribosyl-[dinitrogen reductase] hydrolase